MIMLKRPGRAYNKGFAAEKGGQFAPMIITHGQMGFFLDLG